MGQYRSQDAVPAADAFLVRWLLRPSRLAEASSQESPTVKIRPPIGIAALSLLVVAGAVRPAQAGITFTLNSHYHSTNSPMLGAGPWGTATFTQGANANQVILTMTLSNTLGVGQYLTQWFFNFGGSSSQFSQLNIQHQSGVSGSVTKDRNDLPAPGDGNFDILFTFAPNTFTAGQTSVFLLTLAGGLNPTMFNSLSSSEGDGPLHHAATLYTHTTTHYFLGIPWLPYQVQHYAHLTLSGNPITFTEGTPGSAAPAPPVAVLLASGGFTALGGFAFRRRRSS
jgi:hypothetical protein